MTSWIGNVRKEKKTFDTPSSPVLFLKPCGIQGGSCGCSLPLIRGFPLGIQLELDWILYLYLCGWGSHQGDKAECQECRSRASPFFFFFFFLSMILIDCRALRNLTQLKQSEMALLHTLDCKCSTEGFTLNGHQCQCIPQYFCEMVHIILNCMNLLLLFKANKTQMHALLWEPHSSKSVGFLLRDLPPQEWK